MRIFKLLVPLAALGLLATACGGGASGEFGLVTEDALTVCTDTPYPPMEFEDPTTASGYSGFDIELIEAIAGDLDLELSVATPGWDAITSGLAMESGNCDISASSITITPEREENIDFSDSYFSAEQSLLVAGDNSAGAAGDIGKIAVQSGTTGEIYAQDNLSNELISFEDAGSLYLALAAGEVDGVITDLVGNQGYIDDNPGVAAVIQTWDTNEQYGFAVKEEGSEKLLEAVNESLGKLRDDGTYDSIFDKWFSG